MNEQFLPDPELQAFESRLAALSPKASDTACRDLLYQCAFAVGQRSAHRRTRTWQGTTVVLVLLLMGTNLPLANQRLAENGEIPAPSVPVDATDQAGSAARPELVLTPHRMREIPLDAWQPSTAASDQLATEFVNLQAHDSSLQAFTMGALRAAEF